MRDAAGEPIRLIVLGETEAWKTQAVYHALAERMTAESPDTIILCRPASPYVCLGYHQPLESVLDRSGCARLGLAVFRRHVGGGMTLLDSQQVFYQCVFHPDRLPARADLVFERLLAAPVQVLRRLGLAADLYATNEIEVRGRRIAGTGGGRIGEASVVVGNLLLDFDFDTMAQLWCAPTGSFRALARDALNASITTLKEQIGAVDGDRLDKMLVEEYERTMARPMVLDTLTLEEWEQASKVGDRLCSEEFLGLHEQGPPRPLKISARVQIHADELEGHGARVRLSFYVREGIIEEARLESEPPQNWREWQDRLRHVLFSNWREVWRQA